MTEAALVITADDGGLHGATDDALIACARTGVVRNVSVVATGPTAQAFVPAARDAGLDLGLHLNLTEGRALGSGYRTITNAEGEFLGPKERFWTLASVQAIDPDEVAREARLQWDRLIELGASPTFLNGHNHVQVFGDVLEGLVIALGAEDAWLRLPDEPECPDELRPQFPPAALGAAGMRARAATTMWRFTDRFVGHAFAARAVASATSHLEVPVAGVTEWMVHPGPRTGSVFTESSAREEERGLLCRRTTRERLESLGYRIATWSECS